MPMRPELRTLIHEYQRNVETACRLLQQRLGLPKLDWFSWRQDRIPGTGWLDDAQSMHYRFHGIGCCMEYGSLVLDFDLGPGGRRDGFDAWRLSLYAKSTSRDRSFCDEPTLHAELLQLLTAGELVRDGDSLGAHLFYLAADHENLTDSP